MDESATSQTRPWQRPLKNWRGYARKALPFVAGVIAAFAAILLYSALFPPPKPLNADDVNQSIAEAMASATPIPAYSSLVYQQILPSLVFVEVHTPGKPNVDGEDDKDGEDDTEKSSVPTPEGAENAPDAKGTPEPNDGMNGLGSGVIINTNGEVLTSLHVVTNATDIRLTFADGTESVAQIIDIQPDHDIAVLHPFILPKVLVPAVLGNPRAMRIGDEAYAVGHPFGLYGSMSSGVISGFERTFRVQNSNQRLEGLIQIDAAVNPGNSGGPLLNRVGQVIGIVTGLANPTDQSFFVGIGFAVPIDVAGGGAGVPPY